MKKHRKYLWTIYLFMLLSFTVVQTILFADDSQSLISKISVTFYGEPASSKGFTWYTGTASTGSDLQVVEKGESDNKKFCNFQEKKAESVPDFIHAFHFSGTCIVSAKSPGENIHKAEATGLKSGTTYFFRVGDAKFNLWSEVGTFQTAAKHGAFTFINLTDTQAKTEDEAVLSGTTLAKALTVVSNAKFVIHSGDIVDTGSNEQQWSWLFGHSQNSLLNTTIVPIPGNHEEQPNAFMNHFDIKPAANSETTTGAYYSFNYSNAHFINLNNNEESGEFADFSLAQIQWLKDDVASARAAGADWIIVNMHKGPYTISNHATDSDIMGENGVRTKVAPIFSELGVDLVLEGHDHIYSRSKPINNGVAVDTVKSNETDNGVTVEYALNPDGVVYLNANTAGPKVYYKNKKIEPGYFDLFEYADEHHAALYGPDPKDATRPVRAQIQNFIAITIDADKLTAIAYEIDQGKNNAKPYIIDLFGILKTREHFKTREHKHFSSEKPDRHSLAK